MFRVAMIGIALLVGCGDSHNVRQDAAPDASSDAGVDASCFTNPQTHYEIINACTENQPVDKTPVTPLRNSDGSLPPLP
jgi:methylmalonyl-CoA mutase cobalamin-binding subunit